MKATTNESPKKCLCSQKGRSAARKRILCVGMCTLDIVHVCHTLPEEDTKFANVDSYWQRGGNSSNNCTVLRQLGADCEYLGVLTDVTAFRFLLEDCQKRGIRIDNCPRINQNPPFSTVIIVKSTDSRSIVHSMEHFPILTHAHFRCVTDLSLYSWIHFEARNPPETMPMIKDVLAYNRNNAGNITISVDIEEGGVERLPLGEMAHVVILGKDFAERLGWNDPQTAATELRKTLRPQPAANNIKPKIIVPWGGKGSGCLDENDNYAHLLASPPKEFVDALGAGDTFCAACIFAMNTLKFGLADAVTFGNTIAGYKIGLRGYDGIDEFFEELKKG